MDLTRLHKEGDRLLNELKSIPDEKTKRKLMIKLDDLITQMECETYSRYYNIAKYCKSIGINKVYDIGCASGYQSEMFLQNNLEYVGIEGYYTGSGYWNDDKFRYIEKEYPFKIHANQDVAAISSLCIGWNCFKYKNDTWEKQAEALARDFKTVILYSQKEFVEIIKPLFNYYEEIKINDEIWYLLRRG